MTGSHDGKTMKHQAPTSLKFLRLQRRLKESKRGTVGILELLWHATLTNAPQGDIGKFTDEEIAVLCDWEGEPGDLIQALLETGWIDSNDTHRLVIHDWNDHCPRYIKGNLRSHSREIVSAKQPAEQPAKQGAKQPAKQPATAPCSEQLHLTQPNLTYLPLPPPKSNPPTEDLWEAAEAELSNIGVAKSQSVCDVAKSRGCTPAEVRAAVVFWQSQQPAWEIGALVRRLENLHPGQDPALPGLWPPSSKAAAVAKSREGSLRKQAALEKQKAEADAKLADEAARIQDLETRYGDYLDGMTESQIRKFAVNAGADFLLKSYRPKEGVRGILRETLLLDMAATNRKMLEQLK